MAKIFVFEWTGGGGLLWEQRSKKTTRGNTEPRNSDLQGEGLAMLQLLQHDFVAAGHEVMSLLDYRIDEETATDGAFSGGALAGQFRRLEHPDQLPGMLQSWSHWADYVIPISPETGGCLTTCLSWLDRFSAKLVTPTNEFAQICVSKHRTCEYLSQKNIATPSGQRVSAASVHSATRESGLVVENTIVKPDDGAGGQGVCLASMATEVGTRGLWRVESRVEGLSVSVCAICGGVEPYFLPATEQLFGDTGHRKYVGGRFPLSLDHRRRAEQLARKVMRALPPTRGWVGIDAVLTGDDHVDFVIEVNPRMTSSYLLLRQTTDANLAEAMLQAADGSPVRIEFGNQASEYLLEVPIG